MATSAPERRALFVIDIQNLMVTDTSNSIPRAEDVKAAGSSILSSARGITDSCRRQNKPAPSVIVVVQHEEDPDSGGLVRGTGPWGSSSPPRSDDAEEWLVAKTTRKS